MHPMIMHCKYKTNQSIIPKHPCSKGVWTNAPQFGPTHRKHSFSILPLSACQTQRTIRTIWVMFMRTKGKKTNAAFRIPDVLSFSICICLRVTFSCGTWFHSLGRKKQTVSANNTMDLVKTIPSLPVV